MSIQIWAGVLTAVGLAGFFLAGKKIWWAWYVNIANQVLWLIYAIVTEQWPFIVGVVAYSVIFTKNAIAWTKEHRHPVFVWPREMVGEIHTFFYEHGTVTVEGSLFEERTNLRPGEIGIYKHRKEDLELAND